MLSIVNEVDPLIFLLHMFCIRYKHVFFQHKKLKAKINTNLGLQVCLRDDLLDPPLKEPPSVSPS